MAEYDVVVVGGGLGGLACAIRLARAGRRVCVCEGQEKVGGYAMNFDRGPYRFDASLHMLDAVEPGRANRGIWESLGLHESVPTATPPLLRREIWPEHDLSIGQGMQAWVDALSASFPHERDGLTALAAMAADVHAAVTADRNARLAGEPPPPLVEPLHSLLNQTAGTVMRQYLRAPTLVSIAGSLSCYLGLGCDELAAIPYLTMLHSYHAHSGSYPVGGSGAIPAALARTLTSLGGEIRTDSPVLAIRTERRTVTGVTLASGEDLDAPLVVSNASPPDTYGRLVDTSQVNRRFLRQIQAMSRGTSVIKIWLGMPKDALPPGLPYETFLRTTYGTTFCDGTLEDIGVVAPHKLDPTCAPAGGAVLSITAGAEAFLDRTEQHKALADAAVHEVESRLVPGLQAAADVRVVATPRTFYRYTDNPGGTIHGFRPVPSQSGPRRLGIGGPVGGLYTVGGWTYAGSGFLPAMTSGLIAAAAIEGRHD
ncbi:MAG: NAD(P)/FAD-dependent oxidoreductase [Proteobacteria bacterium]|nr:NAD(P)/FAD-dependent oxidoreductase [Pseudomonadota bacterium]